MPRPKRTELEQQLKYAFQEFLMSGEFLGLKISHTVSNPIFDAFMRYLSWRWDRLYKPKEKKKHTKEQLKKLQRAGFGRIK